jgi:hypothetical protein
MQTHLLLPKYKLVNTTKCLNMLYVRIIGYNACCRKAKRLSQ